MSFHACANEGICPENKKKTESSYKRTTKFTILCHPYLNQALLP